MFKQGPQPEFDLTQDLKSSLKDIFDHKPVWPAKADLLPFARKALRVKPEYEDIWYLKAWWGFYARRLLNEFRKLDRIDEVLALVEPIDFGELDQAIESGKGVIMASAHLGPAYLGALALRKSDYPVLELSGNPRLRDADMIFARTDTERKQSLVKSLRHLRGNNIITAAPDGRMGVKCDEVIFLGQPIKIFTGVGELAKLSGAETCWFTGSWTKSCSVKVEISRFDDIDKSSPDFIKNWHHQYLNRLGIQVIRNPGDLGFFNGIWNTKAGGIRWYR